jgi:hypothetical protein
LKKSFLSTPPKHILSASADEESAHPRILVDLGCTWLGGQAEAERRSMPMGKIYSILMT